jgi:hypothetical protein
MELGMNKKVYKKSKYLGFSVYPNEFELIKVKAANAELSQSQWIRLAVLCSLQTKPIQPIPMHSTRM